MLIAVFYVCLCIGASLLVFVSVCVRVSEILCVFVDAYLLNVSNAVLCVCLCKCKCACLCVCS